MKQHIPHKKVKETSNVDYLPSKAGKTTNIHSGYVSFSFRYLNLNHNRFNIDGKPVSYFITLIDRIKVLSDMKTGQLIGYASTGYSSQSLRCHPIEWKDTTEKCFGIPNEDDLVDIPRQFSLSANKHGRVHGFFIENVFYIVWLDPEHKLYSK